MLLKFLEEVVAITVGKQAEMIADLLNTSKHVNEFILAKKMDITINQTRNILYKLSDFGLVSSIRKKDKRKGWYTYFWKIEILKSLEFLKSHILKRKEQIENQIKSRETKEFYVCERCNIEFNAENAMLNDFTFNECGEVFTLKDNTKVIREMKKVFNRLEKEVADIEIEIDKEKAKINKKKLQELKKIEKEKAIKRAEAAAKRKKSKKSVKKTKIKKKTGKKKVSKKKVVKKKVVKKKPVKKKAVKKKSKKKIVKKKPFKKIKSKKKK
jgi:transcription factor E